MNKITPQEKILNDFTKDLIKALKKEDIPVETTEEHVMAEINDEKLKEAEEHENK